MVKINTVKSERIHTKPVRAGNGRLKTTEPTARGRAQDTEDASQVLSPSVGQSRREQLLVQPLKAGQSPRSKNPVWVPVINSTGTPLMPCRPAYARALVKCGRAQRRWYKGIFAIKMLDRAEGEVQQVVCGIDPGSKREAFTIQSKRHTYLNVLSDAVTWVRDRVETRRNMRKARRFRKTPCRRCKFNRSIKRLPPSIKSRWLIKLNIVKFLKKLYPITDYVVEDIRAKSYKKSKKWNKSFGPLEAGKIWFYEEISQMGNFVKKQGYETFERRNLLGLKKAKEKKAEIFNAHNIDSWVLASFITGKNEVENKNLFRIIPIQFHRRQLHYLKPGLKGIRKSYGGTISFGFKRGSVVNYTKKDNVYIGGTAHGKISLCDLRTGKRLTEIKLTKKINFLYYNSWRTHCLFAKS